LISSSDGLCAFPRIDEIDERFNSTPEIIYEGGDVENYMLYGLALDETQYTVCTTLQYFPYKPTSNTTTLTVEPQSTHVMRTTKTQEQLQQEAEDSGWLTT